MIPIFKSDNLSKIYRNLKKKYLSSLKPSETEELINQFFNRPVAFLTAMLFNKLKKTPNFVTFFSMLFGVSAGFFFAKGKYPHVMIGALLLQMWIVLDCADGQLARMTGTSSQFGKTLDGLADVLTHISTFYGTAYALYKLTGSLFPFFTAFISQFSMYLHIILYDHFKNVFISVTKPEYVDKLENIDELRKKIEKNEEHGQKKKIKNLSARLYYYFYRIESSVVSIGYLPIANNFYGLFPDIERIDPHTRELYYREMRLPVKAWSFIGDTIHLTFFVVFGILNRITYIFPVIYLGTNICMVFALLYQRVKFKKFGLEREILLEERFE